MHAAAPALKRAVLTVAKHLGGYRAFTRGPWRRRRLFILCYHGVSQHDEHLWNPALYVAQQQLEARLRVLKALGCRILPLGEALQRLYAGDLPDRSVALTFDDGYYDFYSCAYPVLATHQMPATVYLTTYRCFYNKPIFRLLCSYLLWQQRGRGRVTIPDVSPQPFDLNAPAGRLAAFSAIVRLAEREHLTPADRGILVERIADRIGACYADIVSRRVLHLMNEGEVRELARAGVDFQLHTHTHTTRREASAFGKEIVTNRERIEQLTGMRPQHFCYPSGIYAPEFLPWLREAGVVSATTCDPGLASQATNPLMLPRLVDSSTLSQVEFEGWVVGVSPFISRRRAHAGSAH